MSPTVEQLKPTLDALSISDRDAVIRYLVELDGDAEEMTDEEWEAELVVECERRMADYKAGRTFAVSGEELMAKMREKYG